MTLVIGELTPRFCCKTRIIPEVAKVWSARAISMALAERSIGKSLISLISAGNFWVVVISVAAGSCLPFKVFAFVVLAMAQPIQEGKAMTCHRQSELSSKRNIATCLAVHDWLDQAQQQSETTNDSCQGFQPLTGGQSHEP